MTIMARGCFFVEAEDGIREIGVTGVQRVLFRSLRDGRTHTLLAGEGNYKRLAFAREGPQVAFLSDRDSYRAEHPRYALYHAEIGRASCRGKSVDLGGRRIIKKNRFHQLRSQLAL